MADGWHARFVQVVTIWTAVAQVSFGVAVAGATSGFGLLTALSFGLAAWLGSLLAVRPLVLDVLPDRPRAWWRVELLERTYLVHWAAAHFATIGLVVSGCAWLFGAVPATSLWTWSASGWGVGVIVCSWGTWVTCRRTRIRRYDVPIRGLSAVMDGYRIVQLSDLHIGSYASTSMASRWVAKANELRPDLVVVTGDMVSSGVAFHRDIADVLATLRATDGVAVIAGNHDYFGDGYPLFQYLEDAGIRVLRNAWRTVVRGDARFVLVGVDDAWTGRADLAAALRDRPEGPTIVLAHDPALFPAAARARVDLVLSGHTHGGQIALPFIARWANLTRLSHRHSIGVARVSGSTLIVSAGLGTTGLPLRLGVPPEVVLIRLHSAGNEPP